MNPILRKVFLERNFFSPLFGGMPLVHLFFGGGGSPGPTTTTVNQNKLPDYAEPYYNTLMGAATNQIFQTDPSTGAVTGIQPYKPYSTNPSDYVAPFSPLQQQSFQAAGNLQSPSQFGTGTGLATEAGVGQLGSANQAQGYGTQGAQSGQLGQGIGVAGGLNTAGQALGYGGMGAGLGAQSVQAGQGLQNTYTDPNAMAQYMNPYIQNALNPALQLSNQSYGMQGAQEQSVATRSGAFGGSREALMNSLNNQSRDLANQQMIGNAYNEAYTNAQTAAQQANTAQLQGLQQGISGANTGLQGVQGAQAGVNQALAGTNQGMQGAQAGLQGVSGTQAGLAGANQAAGTLGDLGTSQLAADTSILGTQNTMGAQQQAQQQNIINQAVSNYATAQQYPYQLLNQYNALVQGYAAPTASSTTYQAAPSAISQIGGLGATALGALGSTGAFKKKGGVIKEKKYAGGGLVELAISKAIGE